MKLLKILLSPLAFLYKIVTDFRNYLYDIGHFKSFSFQIPLVVVGNLTVGGTGKTPHVEYLIRYLTSKYKVGVLSRGYGRKTKGYILADENESANTIGDEPMQYFLKYGKEIIVSVCESRAFAVPCIAFEKPETEVIVLDDAFQHRKVKAQFNILLSDYKRPFYEDYLLPSGLLRESRAGANRADAIIVSKCPLQISETEKKTICDAIQKYAPSKPVFFTTIEYAKPQALFNENLIIENYKNTILFAGLANIEPLETYIKTQFDIVETLDFKDHYKYKTSDIERIKSLSTNSVDTCLITTEKDMVKLLPFKDLLKDLPIFYIPIEIRFLENENEFQNLLLEKIKVV